MPKNKPAYREPFDSLGEFLAAVVAAGIEPGTVDQRLQFNAAGLGADGDVPSRGGFLVPVEQAADLHERLYTTGAIISRCTSWPATKETFRVPIVDEKSRANGSRFGGIVMSFTTPGSEITASKPKFAAREMNRRKLAGLVHVTNEMLADVPTLGAIFERLYALEGAFVIEREIVNGNGTAGPLGILKSGALISVAAESGQAAATILPGNIVNMYSRLWAGGRSRAVWLVNSDVFPQLLGLTWSSGTSVVPLFTWGADGTPRLCGRPVVETEACPTLGSLGDIILADLGEYLVADPENIDIAFSEHINFANDEGAFRFRMRVDGAPAWATPTTPLNGTATVSPFVALEARA